MKSILKYFVIFPILLISFSCDETVTDSEVYNGDVLGSWMLTGLTGTYTYTVDLPAASESGLTWAADTSFGIKIKWNYADAVLGASADKAQFWIPGAQFSVGDISLYTVATYDLPTMQAAQFGLIGVFEDAPSLGADATYKMKGTYPGIFYNYSLCSSAGSTAPMTDQGLYTWDQTSYNFTIKRDPSIAGSQVLPQFNDGTLTMTNDTTMNIVFKDRDSHSTLYSEIMDSWDEGSHPDATYGGGGENSGGDRTYMAFPPLIVDASTGGFAGTFDGTNGTPATSGYFYSTTAPFDLSAWGGYATFYYLVIAGEAEYLTLTGAISDSDGDGSVMVEAITYMTINNAAGSTYNADPSASIPYSLLVSSTGVPTNDSILGTDGDFNPASPGAGGKLTFNVISDCAAPVDVTIDFDATFTKCTTDNCTGDGYHVTPTWD